MPRDLVSDSNDNLRRAFGTLATALRTGERREFGPLTAAAAGVPVPMFNRVFVFDVPPVEDLSAAIGWMARREEPFWITATDPAVDAVENRPSPEHDLAKTAEHPGMAISSLEEIPPNESAADVAEVTDRAALEEFSEVVASVFETPLPVQKRIDRAALAANETHLFLGRVEGDPVASGLLVRTGDVAGVYEIGVVESYRRRGIGEAMTRAVLRAGRDSGCAVGVLQSSEMATSLYEGMGFEPVVTYHQYGPAT